MRVPVVMLMLGCWILFQAPLAAAQTADEVLPPLPRPQSDHAVERGLRFLVRHQGADGSWRAAGYPRNCDSKPAEGHLGNVRSTALALLAFADAGYDAWSPNKFRRPIRGAWRWLLDQQTAGGAFSEHPEWQAMAIMALARLAEWAPEHDADRTRLLAAIVAGVDLLISQAQRDRAGAVAGWPAVPDGPINWRVTAWAAHALLTVEQIGLGPLPERAEWWATFTQGSTADHSVAFPRYWDPATAAGSGPSDPGAWLACIALAGHRDQTLAEQVDAALARQLVIAAPVEPFAWYHDCFGAIAVDGLAWRRLHSEARRPLIHTEQWLGGGDCLDGSAAAIAGGQSEPLVDRSALLVLSITLFARYWPGTPGRLRD